MTGRNSLFNFNKYKQNLNFNIRCLKVSDISFISRSRKMYIKGNVEKVESDVAIYGLDRDFAAKNLYAKLC